MAQINKPSDYFNTKLYTGNGTSSHAITGVNFQPDFLWIKPRSAVDNHVLFDSVRGASNRLNSNGTNAEASVSMVNSFDSDGFTLNTDSNVNGNGTTYASWNWLASNTTASNTDGSITSTVSASTVSGFSIGTYSGNSTTGATVGHGLGSAPSMVIVKKTNNVGDWYCYHSGIGATAFIKLNDTGASATNTLWNDTAPTSSVFSMDSNSAVNGSGDSYVFYAFAEKKGFSKFGSYTSISSHDANFVYLGFKPAMIIFKNYSYAPGTDWHILDRTRYTFNSVNEAVLEPNTSDAESYTTFGEVDFLSNGFKIRNNNAISGGGYDIIYMAFAENPLVGTNNIPATAR